MKTPPLPLPLLALALLAGCGYSAPVETDFPLTNVIAGEVTLAIPVDTPGNVIIFVTDASNPMPPQGTGRPLAAGTVQASKFSAGADGMASAPWSVSGIPDGQYVITAFMDMDDNFHPLINAMAGATCHDIVGAHLDGIETQNLAPVSVGGGTIADDISIVLAQDLPLQRPAFKLASRGHISLSGADENHTSQVYTLDNVPIDSSIYSIDGPDAFTGPGTCGAIFALYAEDADHDGHTDPHPNPAYAAEGLLNVWPKVGAQYLGPITQDADGNDVIGPSGLQPGEAWLTENVPSPSYSLLGTVGAGQTVFKDSLDFNFLPGALHITADNPQGEIVTDVSQLPHGAWNLTVVSFTGQTWTVPNELPDYPVVGNWDATTQLGYLDVEH